MHDNVGIAPTRRMLHVGREIGANGGMLSATSAGLAGFQAFDLDFTLLSGFHRHVFEPGQRAAPIAFFTQMTRTAGRATPSVIFASPSLGVPMPSFSKSPTDPVVVSACRTPVGQGLSVVVECE